MSDEPHEEDALAPRTYDWTLLRRLLRYLRPHAASVAAAFALIVAMSGLDLVAPYLTKVAIDRHIARGDAAGLARVAGLYLLTLAAGWAVRYLQNQIMQMTGQRIMQDLRREIYGHLQRLHVAYFDRNPVGRLMTRVTTDVDAVNELFTSGVVTVFGDLFALVGIMVVMLSLDWRLALVTFSVIPLFFLLTNWFRKGARSSFRETRRWVARINAFLQENLSGMAVVQLFRREQKAREAFAVINRKHADANLRAIFYYAVFYPAIEFLAALAMALILIQGGSQVLSGALTLGALVAFIQYSERFWRPISDLSEKFNVLQAAMAASERIFEMLDTHTELKDEPDAVDLPPFAHAIEFRDVSFRYDGDRRPTLRQVSFEIAAGKMVAIVGRSGAGKTTLVNLLPRFFDVTNGAILVDGLDIRDVTLASLRAQIAMVTQETVLFDDTIERNIAYGMPGATREQIEQAARAANAHDFIAAMPGGYDTVIGERGQRLSGGQRQRLAIARALLRNSPILILDEATSSLDAESERVVQEALDRVMEHRTTFVIAHRLSTILRADKILVLKDGSIVETGTHASLLARPGVYAQLYETQLKAAEVAA